jgi:hypothetical protein
MVKLYACLFTALMIVVSIAGCAVLRPGPVAVLQTRTETPPPPTSTPRPSSTPTTTPTITLTSTITPSPTLAQPQYPKDVINNSWGILDEGSFKKIGDEYVLARKVKDEGEEGDVIFRWDPRTGWRAVRSYWECGKSPLPGTYAPTGLISKERAELSTLQVQARACLLEVDSYPDPNYPEHALRGKLLFYDNQRNPHIYNFMSGGVSEDGRIARGVIAQRDNYKHVYRRQERDDLAQILRDYLDAGVKSTRQVDINYITKTASGWAFLTDHMKKYEEINKQLEKAIRTGRNFPEVQEDYFIYALVFDITPLPWSVVPKTR